MKSRLLLAGVFIASLSFASGAPSLLAQNGPPPPGAGGPMEHMPLPKPTNLKVLPKNIPPKELMNIMHGFAGSLGVHCTFCHVRNEQTRKMNFASDEKPEKASARVMMRMTREMNEKYIARIHDPEAKPDEKHVTCGTCHRGHARPPVFVIPPEEHHGPGGPGGPGEQHPG